MNCVRGVKSASRKKIQFGGACIFVLLAQVREVHQENVWTTTKVCRGDYIKTVNGTNTGYLYDGLNPVQELAGATPKANILTGLGIDEFYRRTDATGARDLLTDALGSVIALADNLAQIKTEYTYAAYGETSVAGEANDNPFQYTGRENDGTGLYYYRARYFNPELSRFISEDPIGFRGGINQHAYTGGNPINFTDPLGLVNPGTAVGAGIGTFVFPGVGTVVGAGVGTAIGIGIGWWAFSEPTLAEAPENARDRDGPKAPGKPGEAEGFEDPKGGENWVPNPNGSGNGWQDKKGNVWCPTGKAGSPGSGTSGPAHGGEHWDVQIPGGRGGYNIYPGGKRRGR